MNLISLKNKVTNTLFETLLGMYPTGYTDDEECPNLLFIVNQKEHVDFLIDNLKIDISQKNKEDEPIIDRRVNDDIGTYKFWKYLSFFSQKKQERILNSKSCQNSSFETLSKFFNESVPLQNLLIKKFVFFENIEKYATICDVNKVINRFLIDYKKETIDPNYNMLSEGLMGVSFKNNLQDTLPSVSKYLNKENLLELLDLRLFRNVSIFYLYKNELIDEDDFKIFIEKTPDVYRYVKKEELKLIIDEKTGYFKEYLNVYDVNKPHFGFSFVAGGHETYLNYASPDKINITNRRGESIIFEILSEDEVKNYSYRKNEIVKLFLEKGGDISIINNENKSFLSKYKSPENLLFIITLLHDNGINIFDNKYSNVFNKAIMDMYKNYESESKIPLEFFQQIMIKIEKESLLKNINSSSEQKTLKRL